MWYKTLSKLIWTVVHMALDCLGLCATMWCLIIKRLLCWCITFPFFSIYLIHDDGFGDWHGNNHLRGRLAIGMTVAGMRMKAAGMGTMLKIVVGMGWGWQVWGLSRIGTSICPVQLFKLCSVLFDVVIHAAVAMVNKIYWCMESEQ